MSKEEELQEEDKNKPIRLREQTVDKLLERSHKNKSKSIYLYAGPKALIMTPKTDMFPAPWSFSRALSKCLSHCGTILAARLLAFKIKVN